MLEHSALYVVVDEDGDRHIQAVCATAEEAAQVRDEIRTMARSAAVTGLCATELNIYAMNAVFPGDRYRLVYGAPDCVPKHVLEVMPLQISKVTNTDAHSEAYLYPDELYIHRKKALAAAAKHNLQQLKLFPDGPWEWAIVVEVGEPLWFRYRSECLLRKGVGWEDTDLVRPVRVIRPTADEVSLCAADSTQ